MADFWNRYGVKNKEDEEKDREKNNLSFWERYGPQPQTEDALPSRTAAEEPAPDSFLGKLAQRGVTIELPEPEKKEEKTETAGLSLLGGSDRAKSAATNLFTNRVLGTFGAERNRQKQEETAAAASAPLRSSEEIQKELDEANKELSEAKKKALRDEFFAWGGGIAGRTATLEANDARLAELQGAVSTLEAEQRRLENAEKYASLKNNPDFAEKSEARELSARDVLDDPLYNYVNGGKAAGMLLTDPLDTVHGKDKLVAEQMTPEEVRIYNYLHATEGRDTADAYVEFLQPDLNARNMEDVKDRAAEWTDRNLGTKILGTAASVAMAPLRGLSYAGQAQDYITTGRVDPNAPYNIYSALPSTIRQTVSNDIEKRWGKVGSFAYNTGMSMADFLLTAGVSGGSEAVSRAIIGTGAAADATIAAKERGLSDTQSFVIGCIAGAAEIASESISYDKLFKNADLREAPGRYILQNFFFEGAEEVESDVINWLADAIVARDKSEWRADMNAYKADHPKATDTEAFWSAFKKRAIEGGLDFLGGAISGGIMAGGAVTLNQAATRAQINQDRSQGIEAVRAANNARIANASQSAVEAAQTQEAPEGRTILPTAEDAAREADEDGALRMGAEPARNLTPTAEEAELDERVRNARNITEATGIRYGVDEETIRQAEKYGRMLGTEVEFYLDEGRNGTAQNGYWDPNTNRIYYNAKAKEKFAFTFGHEFTHELEGTDAYRGLSDFAQARILEDGGDLADMAQKTIDRYRRAGIALTEEQAYQEIVADWVGNNLSDERAIREISRENASIAKRLRDALDTFITRAADMQGIITQREEQKYRNIVAQLDRYLERQEAAEAEEVPAAPTPKAGTEGGETPEEYLARMGALYDAGEITEEDYNDAVDLAAEMQSTGQNLSSSTVERDLGPEGKIPAFFRNVTDRARGRQYSISRDEDGTPFVKVDDTRIDTTDKNKLYTILKDIVKSKDFRNMVANGQSFGITTNQGVREWIRGKKSMELFRTDPQAYDDKQQSFQNANELLQASRDYINEETQDKKKVYSSMARGKINFKVGANGYEADIIVGIRHDQSAELYNVVEVKPKKITESSSAGASALNAALGSQENSVNDIVSQPDEDVKGVYENTEGDVVPAAVSDNGETLTEELRGGTMVKYSLSSWNDTDKDAVMKNLVDGGFSWTDAQTYIDNVNGIAAIIAGDRGRLDYEAADNQVFMKPNAEYVITLDASTLCAKRLTYQGTFDKIAHALGNRVMMPEDLIDLSNMMAEDGYQVPCGICYVESRRRNLSKFASEWLNTYEGAYKPTLDEVVSTDGLERLRNDHPDTYQDFVTAMNKKGTMNPKVVQLRTDYRGDINKLSKGKIEKIKRIGGVRIQSFSDFETPHLIDMMQAVLDMSAKQLPAQAYTKVPNFAWVYGDTGIKINLSLIGGIDENGNLTFSSTEGMDFDEAMRLRERYPENVGTILVGMNDAHILAAMADPRIDYIIPFHQSGWSKEELQKMQSLRGFGDYTRYQNESRITGKKPNGGYTTAPIDPKIGDLYPEDYWDYNVSGKENAERYLQLCAEEKRLPKFWNFLVDNGDGSFSLQPDGSTDGYWKTLIDYKMYDNDGKGAPQRAVSPDFNMEEAERVLAEYQGGANELPSASDEFIDKYVKHYEEVHGETGRQYSVSEADDEAYMAAVENGDMESAQRMVDEAARNAGYNSPKLYHGTQNYGFTEFALNRMDDRRSIFLTDNKYVAESYSGTLLTGTPGGEGGQMVNGIRPEQARSMPVEDAVRMYNDLHEHDKGYEVLDADGLERLIDREMTKVWKTAGTAHNLLNNTEWQNRIVGTLFSAEDFKSARRVLESMDAFGDASTPEELDRAVDAYSIILGETDPMNNPAVRTIMMMTDAYENLSNSPRFAAHWMRMRGSEDDLVWNGSYDVMPAEELREELYRDLTSTDEDTGARSGNYAVYAKYSNPLEIEAAERSWDDISFLPEDLKRIRKRMKEIERANRGVVLNNTEWEELDRQFWDTADELYDVYGINVNGGNTTREISAYAKAHGYDAVILRGVMDNGDQAYEEYSSDVYILFDPNAVKGADPVAYDDAGNVIPLTERFNTENPDIRFSISDDITPEQGPIASLPTGKLRDRALRIENRLATALAGTFGVTRNFGNNVIRTTDEYKAFRREIVRPVVEAMLSGQPIDADAFFREHWSGSITEGQGARADFDEAMTEAYREIRHITDKSEELRAEAEAKELRNAELDNMIPDTTEELVKLGNRFKDVKKRRAAVMARLILTEADQKTVEDLVTGKITDEEAYARNPFGIDDILQAAEAEREYRNVEAAWGRYTRRIAERKIEDADRLIENADQWRDKGSGIAYARETPERNLRDIAGRDAPALIDKYIRPVHAAEAASTRFKNEYIKRVKNLGLSRKAAYGNVNSEAEAVQFLGEAEDNVRVLERMHKPDAVRDGQTIDEWRSAIEQFRQANPNLDYAKIDRGIKEFQTIYGELIEQMNRALVENGYEPVNIRNGYFPHFNGGDDGVLAKFASLLGIRIESNALPTSINGLTSSFKPGKTWFGHALERTGFHTDYDAVQGFEGYIGGVSDVIHQTTNIRNLRALSSRIRYKMGDDAIKNRINQIEANDTLTQQEKDSMIEDLTSNGRYKLSRAVMWLDEYTNLLANKKSKYDRGIEDLMGRRAYTWMKNIEGRVAANMIAGNLGSALTNFIPLNQAAAMIGDQNIIKGAAKTMANLINGDDFVSRSDFLTNRRGVDPLIQNRAEKFAEFLSKPMNLIDDFASETIVRGAYNYYRKGGMDEESALEAADEFAAGVMADRSKGALPTIFGSRNPLVKLFTQFQVEVNNEFSTIFKDVPKGLYRNDKDKKNMVAVAAWTLMRYFLGAYLFNDLYESVVGRRAALDPVDILNDTVGDLTGKKLNNIVDMLSGEGILESVQRKNPSDATQAFAENTIEELPFVGGLLGGGRIPISSALPDFENINKAAFNENWSAGKKAQVIGRELGGSIGTYILPPFGGGAGKKAVQTAMNTIAGGRFVKNAEGEDQIQYPYFTDTPAETAGTVAKSLFFGPTATEGGRDWVERGFGYQSAKVTSLYRTLTDDLGENQRAAWDLITTINSGEYGRDNQAKRYAIAQSDLSDEGKAAAMETYMSESEGRKFRGANEFGVGADVWAALYDGMAEYDENANNTYSQKEINAALDNIRVPLSGSEGMTQGLFGGSTDERSLTNREKAVLWAAYGYKQNGKSWKQSNNPYDPDLGERVIDWIDGLVYDEDEE